MEYADFRKVASKGTKVSNEELVEEMKSLDSDSPEYSKHLAQIMTLLMTKKPIVVKAVRLGPSAWGAHIRLNNLDRTSLMVNIPTNVDTDWVSREIINLYEENYGATREFVHQINKFVGEHKIVSIRAFLTGLLKEMNNKPLESADDLRQMMSENVIDFVRMLKEDGKLKYITGNALVNTAHYQWLGEAEFWDRDAVSQAEVAYDLGGGLTTPVLEIAFGRNITCLDIQSPEVAVEYKNSIIVNDKLGISHEEYIERCTSQDWLEFDVTKDAFDDTHQSYFITSFGLTSSTVAIDETLDLADPWIETTYNTNKLVADLVAKGKDVYFFVYSKTRLTIYRNKILAFKFVNGKLEDCHIESDPFSLTQRNHGRRATYNAIRRK